MANNKFVRDDETMLALFEKHASDPIFAKKVFNLCFVKNNVNFETMSMAKLLAIPGMGRRAAVLVMEVACDLAGKK